ncbi:hypothetical protein NW752_007674 [Fusarium irregulare]|uniref:Ig-like domain-containing protein n=1 Tax=Fusarium irregulare TaxID=2494466 RepID=A0A9W8U6I3_9HYPO|nr:hypothetical protein NW766_010032 [Fusarium irregulare]KAJ4013377.1 hypothetical protein NW752_007674 [Fusarium irregulare]
MKISVASVLSLAVLVPTATADFEVYWTAAAGNAGLVRDWAPYAKEPTCDEALDAERWGNRGDVSGNKFGIRCKGTCGADGSIDEMEMNFNENAHWTFYKHRSNSLVDKNGKEIGKCYTKTDEGKYFCNYGPSVIYGGFKRLYCQTSKTIEDIRA